MLIDNILVGVPENMVVKHFFFFSFFLFPNTYMKK